MIDSHAHILSEFYLKVDKVINRDKAKGVIAIINCADAVENSIEVVKLSKTYSNFLFGAVGIHPENSFELNDKNLEYIEKLAMQKNIVAIGEIGLDYHYSYCNKEEQKELFERQLQIAEKLNKPVIVHTRDSIQDTYNILSKYNVKGVIHCFNGSLEMARKFIKLGFVLGIGGVVTFKNCNLYKVIEHLGINNLVLETDSPFLSPEPLRGQQNTPANVRFVAKKIAEIKNIPFDEVVIQTTKNAVRIFDLGI